MDEWAATEPHSSVTHHVGIPVVGGDWKLNPVAFFAITLKV